MEELNQDSTSDEEQEQLPKPPEPVVGAVPTPPKGAEGDEATKPPEIPPPPEKTRTDEEWNKRQSTWDKGLEEVRKQHKDELKQVRTELVTRQRKDFLAQVQAETEAEGGDVQKAVQKAGSTFDREQAVTAREQEQEALAQILDGAKKDRDADELIGKFGLDKTVKDSLLKAETPTEMKTLALEMALETTKAAKTPPIKTPSGVKVDKAFDASKATPRARLEQYLTEKAGE